MSILERFHVETKGGDDDAQVWEEHLRQSFPENRDVQSPLKMARTQKPEHVLPTLRKAVGMALNALVKEGDWNKAHGLPVAASLPQ